jgi:hypothetical protein
MSNYTFSKFTVAQNELARYLLYFILLNFEIFQKVLANILLGVGMPQSSSGMPNRKGG